MAPPKSNSFSVSVVLPASGWEMMAKVRRRATSSRKVAPAAAAGLSDAVVINSSLDQWPGSGVVGHEVVLRAPRAGLITSGYKLGQLLMAVLLVLGVVSLSFHQVRSTKSRS